MLAARSVNGPSAADAKASTPARAPAAQAVRGIDMGDEGAAGGDYRSAPSIWLSRARALNRPTLQLRPAISPESLSPGDRSLMTSLTRPSSSPFRRYDSTLRRSRQSARPASYPIRVRLCEQAPLSVPRRAQDMVCMGSCIGGSSYQDTPGISAFETSMFPTMSVPCALDTLT